MRPRRRGSGERSPERRPASSHCIVVATLGSRCASLSPFFTVPLRHCIPEPQYDAATVRRRHAPTRARVHLRAARSEHSDRTTRATTVAGSRVQQSTKHSARGTGTEGATHRFARNHTNTALRATQKTRGVHPHRSKRIPREKIVWDIPQHWCILTKRYFVFFLSPPWAHTCLQSSSSLHPR